MLGKRVLARSAGVKQRWQWVSPTLSKPETGKGLFQAVKFMRTKASGYPSWPGVTDSTEGRIHWRGPTAILRFSLATLRRTIHFRLLAAVPIGRHLRAAGFRDFAGYAVGLVRRCGRFS